ncbi:FAD-binding oxidoreductase [Cognatishimia sp. MH4019]|uniref:NAD(P)/FAD-dependent oxidoreductase n=1 Tax=Cognatishimia sp. MH4019 TaxID=2854030 RepID=UPI001CD586ED|nr:FAD-dependent oxidoreductase [Cognatishimia sp. MH4019]
MTDIIVIGGGIAGVSAAAELAVGASVTVLEAENALAYHASGRSAAMFLKTYGNQTIRALNEASEAGHLAAGVLSQRGMLLLGKPEEAEAFEAERLSFGMERLTSGEALQKLPIINPKTCAYAGYLDTAQDLDTDLLVQTYRKAALAAGATFITGVKVDAVEQTGGKWHVRAGARSWTADIVVNAAGAWADEVAQLAGVAPLGILPYRRSMARVPAPGGHDTSDWPFVDGINEAWYAKPDAGKWLISPADEDPVAPHDAWPDDMVLAEGIARYQEMVTEEVTRVETTWAGLRSFAPDRALVIGRDVAENSFLWLAGQGGYGFQTAPAAARLCADIALGRAPELSADVVAALSSERFS